VPDRKGGRHIKGTETNLTKLPTKEFRCPWYVEIKQIPQAEGLQVPSAVPDRTSGRHIKGTETIGLLSRDDTNFTVEIKQIPQAEGHYHPRLS